MPAIAYAYPRTSARPQVRRLLSYSDGDTPAIEQPVRMVSCDTPEKSSYAGGPVLAQQKLDRCRQRLESGEYAELPEKLRAYLVKRLGPDSAKHHIAAGQLASDYFGKLLAERLHDPDKKAPRKLALIPTGQLLDDYGRLLAYFSPYFANAELPDKADPRRTTFNLLMIESGWAAFFPIYPSLPGNADLARACAAAQAAWDKKRGPWKTYGREFLLAYEYRLCIKLAEAKTAKAGLKAAFPRACVDLRTNQDVGRYGFHEVPPPYRLWYWLSDAKSARRDLGLT